MNRKAVVFLGIALIVAAVVFFGLHIGSGFVERSVQLTELKDGSILTVRPGTILKYKYKLHESVGFTADYTVSDPKVVGLKENKVVYLHPWNMRPGMTGGDAAQGTFVFRAGKKGTATLTVTELFRGKPESTTKFRIDVR